MTDDDIRIAIAEACGWRWDLNDEKAVRWFHPSKPYLVRPPDYPNDLNAMHEAEKVLEIGHDGSEADDYQQTLYGIVNPGRDFIEDFSGGADVAFLHNLITATARQRAEAFLRTIEKWKE